ncbi:MAG: chemotaxis protein CheW, partial [Gammaproteobacteria bacterium]|nr:chemotaxis protein CheW [Gammaproteobacteria bacterium]
MKALAEQEPLLIFRVGPVMCCAPVRDVDSIVIPQALNHFPGQAPDVAGVFQYRSHTVSVHKLHTKFGLPELEDVTKGRIIMAYTHHGLTGFWADEIEEITSGYEAHWSAPPGFIDGNIFDKTLLWREKLLLHTDFDRLFAMLDAAPLTNWIVEHGDELNSDKKSGEPEGHTESAAEDESSNVVKLPVELSQEDVVLVVDSATKEVDTKNEDIHDVSSAKVDEENTEIDGATDNSSLSASPTNKFAFDQTGEVEEVESGKENFQMRELEKTPDADEVDDSLYYQALDALQSDTDVASGLLPESEVELTEDKQAHIEQLESGEISNLLSRDVENTQSEDTNNFTIEKMEAIVEDKSDNVEMEPVAEELYEVEPLEPTVLERDIDTSESGVTEGAGLLKNDASSYKMIAGVSALIVVAALSGYVIFGGDESVEQTIVPVVEAEKMAPAVTPIAEIVASDDNVALKTDVVDIESVEMKQSSSIPPSLQTLEEVVEAEFNKSIRSNNGAIGSANIKQNANII